MKINNLELNKCNGLELVFLLDMGWTIKNPWTISGKKKIEVSNIDSQTICDAKLLNDIAKYHKKFIEYYHL